MRIAVIGNSHAAGLKRAWDVLAAEFPGLALVFFAAPGKRIADLRRQGDRLIPGNDDLRQRLILSSGLPDVVLTDYDSFLLYGLIGLPQFDRRLSSQLREIILTRAAKRMAGLPLVSMLRGTSPVFLGPAPVPVPDDPAAAQHLPYATLLAEITRRLPARGPRLLPQPADTMTDGITTDPRFLHGPGDSGHMNLAYNSRFLRLHLPALTGSEPVFRPPKR
jgi:hypothetical protein